MKRPYSEHWSDPVHLAGAEVPWWVGFLLGLALWVVVALTTWAVFAALSSG